MKIVFLVHNLTGGGAERVAALWASGFANRGHDVTVLTNEYLYSNSRYDIADKVIIKNLGFQIKNYNLRGFLKKIGILRFLYKRSLKQELYKIRPDFCIGVLGNYALDAYNASRGLNCRIIQTEHNAYDRPDFLKSRPDIIKMKYETNRLFDCVTVLTEADTKVEGVPRDNMVVLPNPLSFKPVDKVPHKSKIILASGRLDVWEVKGFDNLINAWGNIAKKYPDWKLQIAGSGSCKSKEFLQSLADNNNLGKQIEFLGFCDNIIELYRNASVFVLSSRHEGFGMVLTEAMSQGCACVACDFNGRQREIITSDEVGLVCNNLSVDELTLSLEKMLSDKEYRTKCQMNGVERSKYYTLDKTMDRWEAILNNIKNKTKTIQHV